MFWGLVTLALALPSIQPKIDPRIDDLFADAANEIDNQLTWTASLPLVRVCFVEESPLTLLFVYGWEADRKYVSCQRPWRTFSWIVDETIEPEHLKNCPVAGDEEIFGELYRPIEDV